MFPSPQEQLAEIDKGSIKMEDVTKFAREWKKRLFVEGLLGGNLGEGEAIRLGKEVEGVVGGYAQHLPISEIG